MTELRVAARLRAGALLGACIAVAACAWEPGSLALRLKADVYGTPSSLAATGSTGLRRAGAVEAKPKWLRDLEPNEDIVKEANNLEHNSGLAASEDDLPKEGTWPNKQIANPLGHSADETFLPPPEEKVRIPPATPRVGADESPPAEQVVSPTDLGEGVSKWASRLANAVDPPEVVAALRARGIQAETCKEVCMRCHFAMQMTPQHVSCPCFANCKKGTDPHSCDEPVAPGWTNSDVRTRPVEVWQAACSGGDRNCTADCLSSQLLDALRECDHVEPRVECVMKVRELYQRSADELSSSSTYCSKPSIKTCQEFRTVLPSSMMGERKWSCFRSLEECEEANEKSWWVDVRQTPSVWKSVHAGIADMNKGRFA